MVTGATFTMVEIGTETRLTQRCFEKILESVLLVANDVETKGGGNRKGKCVLNISLGMSLAMAEIPFFARMCKYLANHSHYFWEFF